MSVILVCGPPCAGKNHYVEQNRQPDDVVLDQDAMGAKAYNQALVQLERRKPNKRTWVIRCLGGQTRRDTFARRIRADHTVLLQPGEDVLLARAASRRQPRQQINAVRKWLTQEAEDAQPRQPATHRRPASQRGPGRTGRPFAELRKRVFAEEILCWICGEWVDQTLPKLHPMSRTVDHVHELSRGGAALDRGNCRLAHRRCNTIRANQARSGQREQISVNVHLI